ncbi:MAG: hypothetical protein KF838_05830 [Phycisphaeraceae bacterium]|nr:MAG: hypothetical protein KF838_05830 [Phycisphaeraceae bacterium]
MHPPRITMHEAPGAIRRLISALNRNPHVIGISGPVGSGKTTLASKLSGCIIPTDAYLPDYDKVPPSERDNPEHADLARLVDDIRSLRDMGQASIPVWSFHSHKREGQRSVVLSHQTIVVEGIHALDERVVPMLDLAILMDASPSTRWARWEAIESAGERGWGVERARDYFTQVADPAYTARHATYLSRATLVVINE